MVNLSKKEYFTARRGNRSFALHCSRREAQLLKHYLDDVTSCSKAEYRAARQADAKSYADALKLFNL